MNKLNAAQVIRFNLGCDVSHGVVLPMPKKLKTVPYGRTIQAHFDSVRMKARAK